MTHEQAVADVLREADAECERILALSDEEICAELRAEGLDPEQIARDMRETFECLIAERFPELRKRTNP